MKNKLLLLALALITISGTALAQNFKITGTVVDSLGVPLQMANVIAYQQDKNLGAFGITNQAGNYKLEGLKKDSTYTIKVSFLGLKQIEEKVENLQADLVKNFMMVAGADELDAVNLTYQMPVSIKGDTIVYDADSFTNGTEDKLGDVLKKLPGVEVNEDGDITVEGQAVEKVQVEGKDFFEGDSRLATKNIPADAVSKVQVLKNYNNQSQLKGLGNDQDRYVINIKLKEGKKKFWFGEATVGAGYGGNAERYLIQPKAFYYSEDFSINILTDFNNLGVPAFTGRDFRRFTGFTNRDTRQNNASINVGQASTFNGGATNRALSIDSRFLAGNASWKVSDKLDMSAFAILSSSDTRARIVNNRTFIDSGLVEDTDDQSTERIELGIFKLGAEYNPNSDLSINYDGRFNITNERELSDFVSQRPENLTGVPGDPFVDITEDIGQENSQRPISYNQSLNAYYTAGEKHIFAFESQFLNQQEDPFYNAIRNIRDQQDPEPFNGQLGLEQADPFNINQERFVNTNKIDAKLDYFYVLNKKSNINFTVGTTVSQQNYSSDIFQITDAGVRNELQDPEFRNDNVQYNFTDLFAAVHYKFITGKFTFTPGLTAHSFRTLDLQNDVENVIETQRVVPDFEARYDIKSSQTLRLNYTQNVTFNDVNSYAEGIIFRNYNSLNTGNNQLEGQLNDNIRLVYTNFNMFNLTNIFAFVNYSKQRDAIQSQVQLNGINQVIAPINGLLPNESLNGNVGYSREVKKIRLGANVSGSWSSNNNLINGVEQESVNINQSYRIDARSNFQKGINFDVSYNLGINNSDNGAFQIDGTTNTYSAGIDWQLGKRWLLRADYDFNDFSNNAGQENTFEFLDASIRYQKPESRWQYSLIATNLLNADSIVANNFGQIATSTTQTFVLPRYIYFQMRFDL